MNTVRRESTETKVGDTQAQRKLRRILVHVDFLECPRNALSWAAAIARQTGAELTLLHVAPSPVNRTRNPLHLQLEKESKRLLDGMRNEVSKVIAVATSWRTGDAHAEVVRSAKELGADLIVLSRRRRSKLSGGFRALTLEGVIREAPCPVLVIPEPLPPLSPAAITREYTCICG